MHLYSTIIIQLYFTMLTSGDVETSLYKQGPKGGFLEPWLFFFGIPER